MGNYTGVYRDATHTYRCDGTAIIMAPILPGPECRIVYDTPALARDRLKWLIKTAHMRKAPFDAATSRGQSQKPKISIPRQGG